MADLKPAYLIHGDDHGAVAERRARLRALAEGGGDACSVELLEGEQGTPAGVAYALCAMTFAVGRRVLIVDGVERWKQAEVERDLTPAMRELPPDTTLALFAREEGRAKAPAALHKAVQKAGGQIVAESTIKPWELPRWVREQASRMGLALDADAAKALVGQVGERQQRLLRELEKLALEVEGTGGGPAEDRQGGDRAQGRALLAYARVGSRRRARRARREGSAAGIPKPARTGRAPTGAHLRDGGTPARGARHLAAPRRGRVGGGCEARPAHAPPRG